MTRTLPDYSNTPMDDLIDHKAEIHLCNFCRHVDVCELAAQLRERYAKMVVVVDQCAQFEADPDQLGVDVHLVERPR